jgi:hypothetical protein
LTEDTSLTQLDTELAGYISKIQDGELKIKLSRLTFLNGYKNKVFHRYSPDKFNDITKLWYTNEK